MINHCQSPELEGYTPSPQAQDLGQAEVFWRQKLKGFFSANSLSRTAFTEFHALAKRDLSGV